MCDSLDEQEKLNTKEKNPVFIISSTESRLHCGKQALLLLLVMPNIVQTVKPLLKKLNLKSLKENITTTLIFFSQGAADFVR